MSACDACGESMSGSVGRGRPRRYHEGCDPHYNAPRQPRATHCGWCGKALPADRQASMLYCPGGRCRQAAARARAS